MKYFRTLAERVFPKIREARLAMEESRAGTQRIDNLVADLRRLHRDNHFTEALARTLEGRG